MLHDPIEDDPSIKPIIEAADKEAQAELMHNQSRGHLGFCHVFWGTKKRILKEKYGVDWNDPSEMNPDILFD